jgi:glycosyltransferase involved in cell wall biosynthesis
MKILMTSYELPPVGGGGGQLAWALARRLVELGDDVDIVTMGLAGLSRFERRSRLGVYRVPSLRKNPRHCTVPEAASYLIGALPRISCLFRSRRYHLVHSHFILPDGLLGLYAARAAGLPLIVTAHGTDVPGHNPHRVRVLHKCLHPLWHFITARASQIICPSEPLKSRVQQANARARTTVVPNGFDPCRFDPAKPRAKRVLVVTRLVESKGVQYLLRALQGFRSDHEVVIVGDGPYCAELKKFAAQLGVHVIFRGWLENESAELKYLYETSSIFVLPSEAENFPLALLEAMAAGLAIITSQGTGCVDVVGDAAILVPPRDAAAIRAALDALANRRLLAVELGVAARERLERFFGWSSVVDRYREIYRRYAEPIQYE